MSLMNELEKLLDGKPLNYSGDTINEVLGMKPDIYSIANPPLNAQIKKYDAEESYLYSHFIGWVETNLPKRLLLGPAHWYLKQKFFSVSGKNRGLFSLIRFRLNSRIREDVEKLRDRGEDVADATRIHHIIASLDTELIADELMKIPDDSFLSVAPFLHWLEVQMDAMTLAVLAAGALLWEPEDFMVWIEPKENPTAPRDNYKQYRRK